MLAGFIPEQWPASNRNPWPASVGIIRFRPKRSQHDALDALMVGISSTKVNYILDCDLRTFFDSVSQEWLVRFLNHRIGDPRIIRLIRKWLKAGVLEEGVVSVSETGAGQGAGM